MANNQKTYKIRNTFRAGVLIPIGVLIFMIIISLVFMILFIRTQNPVLLFILLGILLFLGAAFIVLCFFAINFFYKVYFHGLFEVTRDNMKSIASGSGSLSEYPQAGINIAEIQELNESTLETKAKLENAYLVTHNPDFSNLNLDYIDEKKHLITYESLRANINNLIFLSQSFRNVVIEVYYNMEEGELSPEQENYLLNLYFKTFADYDKSLFAFRENHRSLLIYLPVIDSFSRINELIFMVIKESSISAKSIQGTINIPARYAIVAYPYSSEDSLISDLRYAKRQNKVVNFFLPNRVKNNVDQQVLLHITFNDIVN